MKRRSQGQVIVEVLLILPVFLMLVFFIMEIGHLSFRTILIHHAAYEVARIGSLTTRPDNTPCQAGFVPQLDIDKMQKAATRMLPTCRVSAEVRDNGLPDPQSDCISNDVLVTLQQEVPLIFPLTGYGLGTPTGARSRTIEAKVRMPIERPLFK